MRITLATESARPDRANEDFVAATPDAIVLLDGVGTAGTESGCIHGTPWYVHQLGTRLLARMSTRPDEPLVDTLAEAITGVRDEHAGTCEVDHPGTPSSTVVLLREHTGRLDYLVLADSVLVLDTVRGLQVITDEREHAVSERLRAQMDAAANGTSEHERAFRDFMTKIAVYRNCPEGFWVAAAKPEAAREAITDSIDTHQVRRAAVLSDGATRLVDRFEQVDWHQLLDILDHDPADLIARTRDLEHGDPRGKRWPRGKATDDASIAYLTAMNAKSATADRSRREQVCQPAS